MRVSVWRGSRWNGRTRVRLSWRSFVNRTPTAPITERIRAQLLSDLAWTARAPATEATWARARQDATNVLTVLWRNGELVGARADEAFFVKCDRTMMTQDDIDHGRLVLEVGVATVKPAEFEIIAIVRAKHRRRWPFRNPAY